MFARLASRVRRLLCVLIVQYVTASAGECVSVSLAVLCCAADSVTFPACIKCLFEDADSN